MKKSGSPIGACHHIMMTQFSGGFGFFIKPAVDAICKFDFFPISSVLFSNSNSNWFDLFCFVLSLVHFQNLRYFQMFISTFNGAFRVEAKLFFFWFLRKKTFYFLKLTGIKGKIYNRHNKSKQKISFFWVDSIKYWQLSHVMGHSWNRWRTNETIHSKHSHL